jgi:hypothetical protein
MLMVIMNQLIVNGHHQKNKQITEEKKQYNGIKSIHFNITSK